eukprot:g2025.t1
MKDVMGGHPSKPWTEPPVPKTLNQPTLRRSTHHSAVIQWQHPPFTDVPVDSFSFRHTTSADWSGEVVEITDVSPSLSQYVITGLRPGQVYIFQVRAVSHAMHCDPCGEEERVENWW